MRLVGTAMFRRVVLVLCALAVSSCGQWRRTGTPVANWPGGRFAEAECDQVLCLRSSPSRPAHQCPRQTVDGTVVERVLMAICQPRRSTRYGEERYRFNWPDAEAAHASFDDRRYEALDAALLASAAAGTRYDRENAYVAALYASLVTDDAQLRAQVAQLGAGPDAQAAMLEMVMRLREPPSFADGATEAERHIFHEVPQRVVAERRAEYQQFADAYSQLDIIVAQLEQAISQGQADPTVVAHLEGLRRARLSACDGECLEAPLVVRATEALVRLHVALGEDDRARTEQTMYERDGSYTASLAAAIYVAQLREIELLEEREGQVRELVARGMNEAVARERVGVAGEVQMPRRSPWRVETSMPDHVGAASRRR